MNDPQGCWHPLTEARMAPHTILRDLNQLLYRIFNSKKVRDNFGFLAFFQVAYFLLQSSIITPAILV